MGKQETSLVERLFHLTKNNTTVKREVIGGITTFMTMAYILAVNPSILGESGMNANGVLIATALAAFVGTMCMALIANYPFALAPGLGLNAFFTYTVVFGMGYSWQNALFAVFIEGIVFIILSVTPVREAIFNSIPKSLRYGVSAGIGMFVAFIGFVNAGIVVADGGTIVSLIDFNGSVAPQATVEAVLALVGILVLLVLYMNNITGSFLWAIFITWILGIICQVLGVYTPDIEAGYYSLYPNLTGWFDFSGFGEVAFKMTPVGMGFLDFIVIMFSFLFTDIFDTVGTVTGAAQKAGFLDKDGKLPRIKSVFSADAIATTAGAAFGTSTTTTFVESTAGIAAGARTGLSSVVTALLFLASIALSPLFVSIPSFATAPALIFVGFLMISQLKNIEFGNVTESFPAYVAAIAMPLTYSISDGIMFGFITYTITHIFPFKGNFNDGKEVQRKKMNPIIPILSVIFILKYIFI